MNFSNLFEAIFLEVSLHEQIKHWKNSGMWGDHPDWYCRQFVIDQYREDIRDLRWLNDMIEAGLVKAGV